MLNLVQLYHQGPFIRMLIAEAICEPLHLLTHDKKAHFTVSQLSHFNGFFIDVRFFIHEESSVISHRIFDGLQCFTT